MAGYILSTTVSQRQQPTILCTGFAPGRGQSSCSKLKRATRQVTTVIVRSTYPSAKVATTPREDVKGTEQNFPRRQAVLLALAITVSGLCLQKVALPALAAEAFTDPRLHLLALIQAGKGDESVIPAIRALAESNPTASPADPQVLEGRWKLLWASDKSEVSIATRKLPKALQASSMQLIGSKGGSVDGRAENWIVMLGGAVTLKLSAAAIRDQQAVDTVAIGPPFSFGLALGDLIIPIQKVQEGGSRQSILGNEQNYYKQLYVENSGKPGDLRLSEVVRGDSLVTGSIFVHERM